MVLGRCQVRCQRAFYLRVKVGTLRELRLKGITTATLLTTRNLARYTIRYKWEQRPDRTLLYRLKRNPAQPKEFSAISFRMNRHGDCFRSLYCNDADVMMNK